MSLLFMWPRLLLVLASLAPTCSTSQAYLEGVSIPKDYVSPQTSMLLDHLTYVSS